MKPKTKDFCKNHNYSGYIEKNYSGESVEILKDISDLSIELDSLIDEGDVTIGRRYSKQCKCGCCYDLVLLKEQYNPDSDEYETHELARVLEEEGVLYLLLKVVFSLK